MQLPRESATRQELLLTHSTCFEEAESMQLAIEHGGTVPRIRHGSWQAAVRNYMPEPMSYLTVPKIMSRPMPLEKLGRYL